MTHPVYVKDTVQLGVSQDFCALRESSGWLAPNETDAAAGTGSIRRFIEQESLPGGRPLAVAFHELAALLDRLPDEQRAPAVQTFVDVQKQLEDSAVDPLKTLEAAAQVTIKAFSQFRRHEEP